jgi:hypothetical protein
MPALSKVKKIAMRVVCATNLKGLGTAQTVYANDYDDEYTVQGGGNGNIAWDPFQTDNFQTPSMAWSKVSKMTVGASLYLLIREADVSPKSFVCPSSDQTEYDGYNTGNYDIVELNDFGVYIAGNAVWGSHGAKNHVSYAYHAPYKGTTSSTGTGAKSTFAADGTRSAAFAVMADKNPWFDPKITKTGKSGASAQNFTDYVAGIVADWVTGASYEDWETEIGNAFSHDREGQNVVYADGHSNYEKRSDVGIKNDNIYVLQNAALGTDPVNWRIGDVGTSAASPGQRREARSSSDTYLVNDDYRGS